jgi:hypothetical protein
MARSLRIEKAGGVYHVINRGNYRQDLFINDGAHLSFESCLFETCVMCGWVLEGYCVMREFFGDRLNIVAQVQQSFPGYLEIGLIFLGHFV